MQGMGFPSVENHNEIKLNLNPRKAFAYRIAHSAYSDIFKAWLWKA